MILEIVVIVFISLFLAAFLVIYIYRLNRLISFLQHIPNPTFNISV